MAKKKKKRSTVHKIANGSALEGTGLYARECYPVPSCITIIKITGLYTYNSRHVLENFEDVSVVKGILVAMLAVSNGLQVKKQDTLMMGLGKKYLA